MTGQPVPTLTPDGFWAALRQPDSPFPIGTRSQGDLEPVQLDLFEPPEPEPEPFGTIGRPGFDAHGFPEHY